MRDATSADDKYVVVVNDEEQHSIWWADRDMPAGWRAAGFAGSRAECLAYIEEVWTDMRPLSLRRRMQPLATDSAGALNSQGPSAPGAST